MEKQSGGDVDLLNFRHGFFCADDSNKQNQISPGKDPPDRLGQGENLDAVELNLHA